MTREETVLNYLREHNIPFTNYNHPEGKTIEEARRWWKDDGSVHCKNLFFRIIRVTSTIWYALTATMILPSTTWRRVSRLHLFQKDCLLAASFPLHRPSV